MTKYLAALTLAALAGCAGMHNIPDSARTDVPLEWVRVDRAEVRSRCFALGIPYTGKAGNESGCAGFAWNYSTGQAVCTIITARDVSEEVVGHELLHCYLGEFHN